MDLEKSNIELLKELSKRENYWNSVLTKLTKRLTCSAKDVVQLQSESLSEKQRLIDEIKYISYELFKFKPIIKNQRKLKTEFYLTKYPIKLQGKDKLYMIEHDLSLYEQRLDIYDTHIDFLRDCSDNFTQINYAIKNKISLLDMLSLE